MKLELKELLAKIINTPLVIEKGSSTMGNINWTYRKWSDGTAECWGITSAISKSVTSSFGYGYYAPQDSFSLPSGLFTSISNTQASLIDASASGKWFEVNSATSTQISGYVYGISSSTINIQYSIQIKGRWK